jgi:hypothetical protein
MFSRHRQAIDDELVYSSADAVIKLSLIAVMSKWNWVSEGFFWGNPSFVWSSMDHFKDNFKENYLIFKLNYYYFSIIIFN